MSYPALPNNRLIVNGVDLSQTYGLILSDGYTLAPPEPKLLTINSNTMDGYLDLTDSVCGDTSYSNRKQNFTFYVVNPENFEAIKTKVSNFLHGKKYTYQMTMDVGYTYTGRFTVGSYSGNKQLGAIQISIDAEPYKLKETKIYKVNAAFGREYVFYSGRKKVRPVIQCSDPTYVNFKGTQYRIPAGTHRLNKVLFSEGPNILYINSYFNTNTTWAEMAAAQAEKQNTYTWKYAQEKNFRYCDLYDITNSSTCYRSWYDIKGFTWGHLKSGGKKWSNLNYIPGNAFGDGVVYVTYDWKDL